MTLNLPGRLWLSHIERKLFVWYLSPDQDVGSIRVGRVYLFLLYPQNDVNHTKNETLYSRVPNTQASTTLWPVRNQATQQEVSGG